MKTGISLRWESDGVQYTKVYTFRRDDYVIDIEYLVENNSSETWQGHLYRQFRRNYVENKGGFLTRLPTFTGGAIYTNRPLSIDGSTSLQVWRRTR